MIKGEKRVSLSKEAIFSKITPYDIFRYYMPDTKWKLNVTTHSPFRQDKRPSFVIGNRDGTILFIDFADSTKKGDCFKFVQLLYNIPLSEALRLIDRDFGLGIVAKNNVGEYQRIISEYEAPEIIVEKKYAKIQVVTRVFTNAELEYWNQYHQSEDDLKANNVYAVKKVYLNREQVIMREKEMVFGYLYGDRWKIYRPHVDKQFKWVPNNVPITAMDGLEDIKNCKVAFINKSKKDYMVMKKIFPCSCAVQNESIGCFSDENVQYLKENSRFQVLSFDADGPGVKNSKLITKKFGFDYCNVPRKYLTEGIKDWSDLVRIHGYDPVIEYLKKRKLI